MSPESNHTLEPSFWVERHADYLFNYAIIRVNDSDLATDLVQDTFLSALLAKDRFRGNSTERTWLTSILKRKIIDVYRKNLGSRTQSLDDYGSQVTDTDFYRQEDPFRGHWKPGKGPQSSSLTPQGMLERKELMEGIRDCISSLPSALSSVFVMKMIDEATTEDICKELEISPSNLWVMLHRARLKLRKCLENKWFE